MFCPVCGAEYRPGFDTCSDCDVALVPELPKAPSSEAPSEETDGVLVWSGDDSTLHTQACSTLKRAGIQVFPVSREDRLFGSADHARFEIYVFPAAVEKAKQVLNESALSQEEWDELEQAGAFELPAEDEEGDEGSARRRDGWNEEDATSEVWSGKDQELADMIVASLQENRIDCRLDKIPSDAASGAVLQQIFVLPEDEARATEIIREIVDASPL